MSRSVRYNFILVVVALSGCLAAFGGWRFAKASAPVNGPILLISVEALRADRVAMPAAGSPHTPNIDALAADGVVFERAYAHSPQTLPSHVTMLTGRLPFETGVRDVAGFRVPETTRTIAAMLRDRGYATGGIVPSFLLRKDTGIDRGFAFFDDERPGSDDPLRALVRDDAATEEVAEHWLDSVGTSRLFLFLQLPAAAAGDDPAEPAAAYAARVARADAAVGRLIAYLKSRQLYDSATILLVSDHGEGLGEHGEQGHGLLAYDNVLHVPLIIKQPGAMHAGLRVATPVQVIDIVPTILDLAKAPGSSGLRGRSLSAALSGGTLPETPIYAEAMFGQYRFGWAPLASVIAGGYQLVVSGPHTELFDLSTPSAERTNVADAQPAIVERLRADLDAFARQKGPVEQHAVTPADRERFELLGYVGVPAVAATEPLATPLDKVAFVEAFRAAVRTARLGDPQVAIDAFTSLTRDEPGIADVWMHLARLAARQERHDLALDSFRQVLALDASATPAHLGAAASALRVRKLDEAETDAQLVLDDAKAEAVQKAEAHEVLARVALNRKDRERARTEAEAAEAADANRPVRAFIDGRIALDEARYQDAVDAFQRALDAARDAKRAPLADLRVYAAEALARADRRADAEQLLNDELAAFPANARARAALQGLLRSVGRPRDAATLTQH
ncbi:MAG: sulfatase-like hydrolase/transferase [Vicinamibacterales bacterium]